MVKLNDSIVSIASWLCYFVRSPDCALTEMHIELKPLAQLTMKSVRVFGIYSSWARPETPIWSNGHHHWFSAGWLRNQTGERTCLVDLARYGDLGSSPLDQGGIHAHVSPGALFIPRSDSASPQISKIGTALTLWKQSEPAFYEKLLEVLLLILTSCPRS